MSAPFYMTTPCPRCGTRRTDSTYHGFWYLVVRRFGYHLRRCSRCRLPRFIRHREHSDPGEGSTQGLISQAQPLTAPPGPEPISEPDAAGDESPIVLKPVKTPPVMPREEIEKPADNPRTCPRCGSTYVRRSHRTFFERLIRRPKMARCKVCDHRFPLPRD